MGCLTFQPPTWDPYICREEEYPIPPPLFFGGWLRWFRKKEQRACNFETIIITVRAGNVISCMSIWLCTTYTRAGEDRWWKFKFEVAHTRFPCMYSMLCMYFSELQKIRLVLRINVFEWDFYSIFHWTLFWILMHLCTWKTISIRSSM